MEWQEFMEWKVVKHSRTQQEIGALGFVGNRIAVAATFYADKDWNHDGEVDLVERFGSLFGLHGKAVTEVLTQAIENPSLMMRDTSLREMHGNAVVHFASGMILDGIYLSYFKSGIRLSCGALAAGLVSGSAARFAVRTGMEQAVKKAYEAGVH